MWSMQRSMTVSWWILLKLILLDFPSPALMTLAQLFCLCFTVREPTQVLMVKVMSPE